MRKIDICVEKTAITNGISASTKLIIKEEDKKKTILDYGCGKLRNTNGLLKNDFENVFILDTPIQIDNIKDYIPEKVEIIEDGSKLFDIVLNSFVLNVIPDYNERIDVLNKIENLLIKGGKTYIEVRSEDFSKNKTSEEYKDGYILGVGKKKTFQKSFTLDELVKLVEDNTNLKYEKGKALSRSCYAVFKK